eukprot:7433698-Alexandrium_andersonii.AAC.1
MPEQISSGISKHLNDIVRRRPLCSGPAVACCLAGPQCMTLHARLPWGAINAPPPRLSRGSRAGDPSSRAW